MSKTVETTEPPRKASKWRLAKLRPNPKQCVVFDELSQAELQSLAASMKKDGLQNPLHILPDGTIIAGHQRFKAAKMLGWLKIDVFVRHDLAALGEVAVLTFLVLDNVLRRQLDPLGVARAYRFLRNIERRATSTVHSKSNPELPQGDLRDRLAKQLGRSGRHLDRIVRLLELPRALQIAVSQNRLPMAVAERVFRLRPPEQEQVAAAIERGEDARTVVLRFTERINSKLQRTETALVAVRQKLTKMLPDLIEYEKEFSLSRPHDVQLFQRTRDAISRILKAQNALDN